ncbi:hypothetical protein BAE44_0023930 [Dichanthelium oligosanthes]|uniref:PGG domain-containing protein n=1 Tax=Dichanthelium oligosanthes TaxID=888268 RepID=A0A1E5UQA5_9POAL|nr:hypothetical protein BAE44_0023930 [Dichanthelium oligosanthes]
MTAVRGGENVLEKKRKLLLILAILAITITYQAGLTPPGKFWLEHGDHKSTSRVIRSSPTTTQGATRLSSTASYNFHGLGRRHRVPGEPQTLQRCSKVHVGTLLVPDRRPAGRICRRHHTKGANVHLYLRPGRAVLVFAVLHIHVVQENLDNWISRSNHEDSQSNLQYPVYIEEYRMRKYLMLLGILAASISRYRAFFYCESTSFMASIVVIALLVLDITLMKKLSGSRLLLPMHTSLVLDLLGLLVAYASGSSRDWVTSVYVLVLAYITIYVVLWSRHTAESGPDCSGGSSPQPPHNVELTPLSQTSRV